MAECSNQISRRHHYLPRSYLAGFCQDGGSGAKLHVFDLELKKVSRPKSPREVAFEPDWHKVELPGLPEDFAENVLGRFEQLAAETLRKVTSSLRLTSDDLEILLNFVALTIVRVPRFRAGIETVLEQQAGLPFDEAANRAENWQDIARWLPDMGVGWTPEDVQRLLGSPQSVLAKPANYRFVSLLLALDTFLGLLAERTWSLIIAADGEGDFICSDNPVSILHTPPVVPYRTPFFTERNTVVTLPLNRRVALNGRFGGDSVVAKVDRRLVATINSQTLSGAWRYLYGPKEDFICLNADGGIGDAAHVFAHTVGHPEHTN